MGTKRRAKLEAKAERAKQRKAELKMRKEQKKRIEAVEDDRQEQQKRSGGGEAVQGGRTKGALRKRSWPLILFFTKIVQIVYK